MITDQDYIQYGRFIGLIFLKSKGKNMIYGQTRKLFLTLLVDVWIENIYS